MNRTPRNSLRNAPVGARYGSLTVLGYAGRNEHKQAMWLCRCDCGSKRARVAYAVIKGLITKCIVCSNKENCTKRRSHADRDAAIIAACGLGTPYPAIASELGTTASAVAAVVRKAKQSGLLPAERAEA